MVKSSAVIEALVDKMDQASQLLEFEKAAKLRDQIATLRKVQQQQYVSGFASELDVVGIHRINSQVCLHVLYIRETKILGSKSFSHRYPVIRPSKILLKLLSANTTLAVRWLSGIFRKSLLLIVR